MAEPHLETATLAGGCFWCLEAVFLELKGVDRVVSGYAGGHVPRPTYEAVCSGNTGHAEVVNVIFDPSVIGYADLLDVFFTIHDPTTLNRQGADEGTQYRSAIYFHSEAQRREAEAAVQRHQQLFDGTIVTEIKAAPEFFAAEEHHQNYYARNPAQGYCRAVVAPKVAKARSKFFARLKRQ